MGARLVASLVGRGGWASVAPLAVLLAIVLAAFVLRFDGLSWGDPFVYHPDEWAIANPAMDMVRTGSWNPHLFLYPSALIYVERFIIDVLHQMDATVSLSTATTGGFAALPWRGVAEALPEQFPYFYAGRVFVASAGALMAIPTYFAARSVSNAVGGIAAAAVISMAPLAVLNSQFLTTDVPTAALAALTLWSSLRGLRGDRRWLVAAGFAAGVAASTKYTGGLLIIVPIFVLLTATSPRQWLGGSTVTSAGLIILASEIGFVLLTPAILFDAPHVWAGGILHQFQEYTGRHIGAEGSDNAIYFLRVLSGENGLGLGVSILAGFGLLISVVRHRRADLAMLSFLVAYYVLISLPPVRFDRNLLPLLPFMAVLVGVTVGCLVDVLRARLGQLPSVAAGLALITLLTVPLLLSAAAHNQVARNPDTRRVALDWIEANVPSGSTIAREEYTPLIPGSEYSVAYLRSLADNPLEWYRSAGFEYLVASSAVFDRFSGFEAYDAFYAALLAEAIVLDLRPTPGQPGPRLVIARLPPSLSRLGLSSESILGGRP